MPKRKTKVITQKQKQTVSQNVVIQLAEKVAKKKRRRAKKKTSPTDGVDSLYLQGRQPPNVVYQYTNSVPQEPYSTPLPVKMKVSTKMPVLEDVGTVGTEGAVEILDLPTKKETLKELINPVPPAFAPFYTNTSISQPPRQFTSPSPFQKKGLASSDNLFGIGPDDIARSSADLFSPISGKSSDDEFTTRNPMLTEEYGLVRPKRVSAKLDPRDKKDTKANLLERYEALNAPPTAQIRKMKVAQLKELVEQMESDK